MDTSTSSTRFRLWSQRPLTSAHRDLLGARVEICGIGTDSPGDPFRHIASAHAVLAGSGLQYTREVITSAVELKVIARTGIGYENVDIAAATERGIAVCNTPDAPTISTAEHTLALIFAATKQLKRADTALRNGCTQQYFIENTALELHGATLGLIGFGRIGRVVARGANAIGMNVLAFDPFMNRDTVDLHGTTIVDSIDAILSRSDVVSLHIPLSDQTRHLIDAARLGQMKHGAYLVNCARGELVDEHALVAALDRGHLAGAAIDVFSIEPPSPNHALLARDDVVATPHVAGATIAGKSKSVLMALTEVKSVLSGRRPQNLINAQVWPPRLGDTPSTAVL